MLAEGGRVVEQLHRRRVAEDRVVLGALLVQQRPVLARQPRQREIVGFELGAVEEDGPGAGVAPVAPLVGHEALEVPALLEPVVPGEGRPPDHDGDVGVGGGPAPAGLQLKTEEAQLQKSLIPVSNCHLFKFLRNCNLRRVKHFFLLFETK